MRHWIAISTLSLIAATGCVSKSKFESAQAELDECKRDKVAAQDAAKGCEERFKAESGRWEQLGSTVSEAVPKALQDFQTERERIVKMVPEQVRKEVETYLDEFAGAMRESFLRLREDNAHMLAEIEANRTKLEELGGQAKAIDEKVGTRLETADAAHARMVKEASDLIKTIQDWDQAYVNDKKSDVKLGLNRKERETIGAFHDQLVQKLNTLVAQPSTPQS